MALTLCPTLAFNLINSHDLITTESRIKAYEQENRESIATNTFRQTQESELNRAKMDDERRATEAVKEEWERLETIDRIGRERERKAVLESLVRQ